MRSAMLIMSVEIRLMPFMRWNTASDSRAR